MLGCLAVSYCTRVGTVPYEVCGRVGVVCCQSEGSYKGRNSSTRIDRDIFGGSQEVQRVNFEGSTNADCHPHPLCNIQNPRAVPPCYFNSWETLSGACQQPVLVSELPPDTHNSVLYTVFKVYR